MNFQNLFSFQNESHFNFQNILADQKKQFCNKIRAHIKNVFTLIKNPLVRFSKYHRKLHAKYNYDTQSLSN